MDFVFSKPKVRPPAPPVEIVQYKSIDEIVDKSDCLKKYWKNRGYAPRGFMRGMAIMYSRAIKKPDPLLNYSGPANKDALTNYGIKGNLKNTYAYLIGLGMRESSGDYCEGRDMSAKNYSASTSEAGLFQISYNSISAHGDLKPLFEKPKDSEYCLLDVFKEGAKCKESDFKNWGEGKGVIWQNETKMCPAYAVEHAYYIVRVLMRHHGPSIRKEVEFDKSCLKMLDQVEALSSENI